MLTTADVKNAKPEARECVLWDGQVGTGGQPGFGLRIRPSGSKSWLVQFRVRGTGQERRMTIGSPDTLPLARARSEAKRLIAEAQLGHDPVQKRRDAREQQERAREHTVAGVFEKWAAERARLRWKPTTEREARRIFETDVLPLIGKRPIAEVTKGDVRRVLDAKEGRPIVQNRLLAWLGALIEWATREEHRSGTNPCTLIERNPEKARERYFSLEELAAIGKALRARPDEERDAVEAIQLLALTGFRRDDVLGLRWDEVSFERRMLILPQTKTGRKLKALGREALTLLRRRSEAAAPDAVWVFPAARGDGHRRDIRKTVREVYKAAEIDDATAHHVWRHTFTTHAAELGFSELIIDAMTGHASGSMTGKYTHLAIDGVVRAADERVQTRIARGLADRKAEVRKLG